MSIASATGAATRAAVISWDGNLYHRERKTTHMIVGAGSGLSAFDGPRA
jgi:hypothetical protein